MRSALKQPGPAAAAYREAYLISEADIETLKGFTGALIADAKPAEAARVVQAARGDAVEGGKLKPIEVELLLAKVYAQWRGHTAQAFATYDDVIRAYPEDFRCVARDGSLRWCALNSVAQAAGDGAVLGERAGGVQGLPGEGRAAAFGGPQGRCGSGVSAGAVPCACRGARRGRSRGGVGAEVGGGGRGRRAWRAACTCACVAPRAILQGTRSRCARAVQRALLCEMRVFCETLDGCQRRFTVGL